jgi:uncharacterized protein YuzE
LETDVPNVPFEYDPEANALYIQLSDKPYSHGRDLDAERRIDYTQDGTPIGVELTCIASGVELQGLPSSQEIAEVLALLHIPLLTHRSSPGEDEGRGSIGWPKSISSCARVGQA